jgi:hypothetical protein
VKSINFKDMVLGDHRGYKNEPLIIASTIPCGD